MTIDQILALVRTLSACDARKVRNAADEHARKLDLAAFEAKRAAKWDEVRRWRLGSVLSWSQPDKPNEQLARIMGGRRSGDYFVRAIHRGREWYRRGVFICQRWDDPVKLWEFVPVAHLCDRRWSMKANPCGLCDCADPTAAVGLKDDCDCGCHEKSGAKPEVIP